jgi:hypothetical protein
VLLQAAVGGAAGFVAGWAFKQSQNMILNSALVGGAVCAGACYAGWVKPEELVDKAAEAVEQSQGYLSSLFGVEEKPAAKLSTSKVMLSNAAKRLPGLMGGAAFGAVLGYRVG